MDFIYLFRILLKRKWLIIGAALIAGLVAWFFTRNEELKFRSVAQISTGFTVTDEIKVGNNNDNVGFFEADTKFNNVIVTFMSPRVVSLLSYSLILHDLEDPHPFTLLKPEQMKSPVFRAVNATTAITVFRKKLESMSMLNSFDPDEKLLLEYLGLFKYDYGTLSRELNVFRLQRTDYIEIDYTSGNPELSAFAANDIFEQFLRYYNTVKSRKSQESVDTLRTLMDRKKQELDAKNSLLMGEAPGNIDNSQKMDAISNLEKTLTDEQTKQTTLYYNIRKINQRLQNLGVGTTAIARADSGSGNNAELLSLRKAMNEAYTAYVNGGSTDRNLLNKYNGLKAQYQNKVVNSYEPASPAVQGTTTDPSSQKTSLEEQRNDVYLDIQASTATINDLEERIARLKGTAHQDASKEVAVETLIKDADQANKDYLAAKQKYNDALDITNSSVSNFRQILVAQPAIGPEPSKRLLIVAMAGIGALLAAIVIIAVLAYLDASIKTPVIFSKVVNLKLISMINFMDLKRADLEDLVTTSPNEEYDPNEKQRHNVFRESMRKLRYEIETSGKKVFLFTSTKKGEGKTTIIQALSYSMSMSKKKILILDTNFCNNDLTAHLDALPALEKIIPDDTSDDLFFEQVKRMSKIVGTTSISIIGSKGGDYTPSEILPRKNILQKLDTLAREYDFIFLEGPPLNDFSDAKELAQYVDGVIAIFSANHIIKQIDRESMTFFRQLNGKFTGSVLNKVDMEMVKFT